MIARLPFFFTSFLMSLVLGKGGGLGGNPLHHALAIWLILATVKLHFVGASFGRERLLDLGVRPMLRRAIVLSVLVLLGALCWWWMARNLSLPKKTVEEGLFAQDELVRTDTTIERLGKLPAAFKLGGSVTAGNSSPFSDGAAAVVMMSAERATALGLRPLARMLSFGVAGVDPDIMGVGPIKAVPKALAKAGLTMHDIDLIEFNEAFAAQALAVARELDMPMDRVNVNGGAIALGHPLGATGAKLTTQLLHELGARGGGHGLVTMCIGGGMGAAGVFEVYPA